MRDEERPEVLVEVNLYIYLGFLSYIEKQINFSQMSPIDIWEKLMVMRTVSLIPRSGECPNILFKQVLAMNN